MGLLKNVFVIWSPKHTDITSLLTTWSLKLFPSPFICPVSKTFFITNFYWPCGHFLLDSIIFVCFVQSRLHLGLTSHSEIYIRAANTVPSKVINPEDKCSVCQMLENPLAFCPVYSQNLKCMYSFKLKMSLIFLNTVLHVSAFWKL